MLSVIWRLGVLSQCFILFDVIWKIVGAKLEEATEARRKLQTKHFIIFKFVNIASN